jgi:rubrerythrin
LFFCETFVIIALLGVDNLIKKYKEAFVMAFFDDLGKKLSQAGQSAVQKTKEMADVAKLNSMVADEEKRIDESYLQIGKLYVSLHESNHEADFDGLISAIHESENKIKDYQNQIKDIKGVVKCEKCGAEVASNAAFCSSCGAPMPIIKPAAETEVPEEKTENSFDQQA